MLGGFPASSLGSQCTIGVRILRVALPTVVACACLWVLGMTCLLGGYLVLRCVVCCSLFVGFLLLPIWFELIVRGQCNYVSAWGEWRISIYLLWLLWCPFASFGCVLSGQVYSGVRLRLLGSLKGCSLPHIVKFLLRWVPVASREALLVGSLQRFLTAFRACGFCLQMLGVSGFFTRLPL